MRHRLHLSTLLLIPVLLAAGCSAGREATPSQPKAINIFIVPDFSESAFATSKDHGEHVVRGALAEAAKTKGRVTIAALTNDTAGQTNIGLESDFAHPPTWVEPTNEQSVAIWIGSLMDTYRKWRAKQPVAAGSDYLGMLLVASRLLASTTTAQQELWVLGDGIQNSRQWSMYRHHPTAAECKTKAAAMKRAGTLGELRGATVYVIGGGINRQTILTPAEQAQLTACWAQIIHTAGGQTLADWWNPARLMTPGS